MFNIDGVWLHSRLQETVVIIRHKIYFCQCNDIRISSADIVTMNIT
jgi:hypothetical protein